MNENNFVSIDQLIFNRRTIHEFKSDVIPPREKIIRAIDLAQWAPNHRLTQPWHFYILGPETTRMAIELNAQITKEKNGDRAAKIKQERWSRIPGWLVMTCQTSENTVRKQEDYAACCCAAQNIMLYLWQEGIGVKWTTGDLTRDQRFYELIRLDPAKEMIVGLFWYGYAAEIPETKRKPVGHILTELS